MGILSRYVPAYISPVIVRNFDRLVELDRAVSVGVSRADQMRAAVALGLPGLKALKPRERVGLFTNIRTDPLSKYMPTYMSQDVVGVLDRLVETDRVAASRTRAVSRADEVRAAVDFGLLPLKALSSVERVELFGRIRSGLPSS